MFLSYKPTWMLDSIYGITPKECKENNIEAILTDLDNTLIAWDNPDGTPELLNWIKTMKNAGIPVIVVSNNKAERVERAVKHLGLDYIARAMKPLKKGFKEAEVKYNFPKDKLIMVGDQLMTDIKGANSAGIRTVLVKPIVQTDAWNTKFNRAMEKKIMTYLKKHHSDMKWRKTLNG